MKILKTIFIVIALVILVGIGAIAIDKAARPGQGEHGVKEAKEEISNGTNSNNKNSLTQNKTGNTSSIENNQLSSEELSLFEKCKIYAQTMVGENYRTGSACSTTGYYGKEVHIDIYYRDDYISKGNNAGKCGTYIIRFNGNEIDKRHSSFVKN